MPEKCRRPAMPCCSLAAKGMSYEGMEIGDGGAAMEAYQRMCECADDPKELAKIRKDLLEYCKQDTLAMVKLLEVIVEKAGK